MPRLTPGFGEQKIAFLTASDGSMTELSASFTIGRSEGASLVIEDEKASRNHALLSFDSSAAAWWATDLQSTNGTYVNGVRIREATRLTDGDRLHIGNKAWIFRDPANTDSRNAQKPGIRTTVTSVAAAPYWLLLVDVVGSSALLERCGPKGYATRLNRWMSDLDALVRSSSGFVNERMGDGLLAVWDARIASAEEMTSLVAQVDAMATAHETPFRALMHFGEILVGGSGYSSGLENLTGPALNHLFKSERALPIRQPGLFISRSALKHLAPVDEIESVGDVCITGFPPEAYFQLSAQNKKAE